MAAATKNARTPRSATPPGAGYEAIPDVGGHLQTLSMDPGNLDGPSTEARSLAPQTRNCATEAKSLDAKSKAPNKPRAAPAGPPAGPKRLGPPTQMLDNTPTGAAKPSPIARPGLVTPAVPKRAAAPTAAAMPAQSLRQQSPVVATRGKPSNDAFRVSAEATGKAANKPPSKNVQPQNYTALRAPSDDALQTNPAKEPDKPAVPEEAQTHQGKSPKSKRGSGAGISYDDVIDGKVVDSMMVHHAKAKNAQQQQQNSKDLPPHPLYHETERWDVNKLLQEALNEASADVSAEQSSEDSRKPKRKSKEKKKPRHNHKNKSKNDKNKRRKMEPGERMKSESFKWKVLKLLGSGGFGDVYRVVKEGTAGSKDSKESRDSKKYAMKTEVGGCDACMTGLTMEAVVLSKIRETKRAHFVELVDQGKSKTFKFIVMGLVGSSLEDVRKKLIRGDFSRSTAMQCAIQTLEAIKDLHELGFLHRDIKPQNFATGLDSMEHIIYLLDFGIAKKFTVGNTKEVKKMARKKVNFCGTVRFASRACHLNMDQGRRDDLETWLFMVYDLFDVEAGITWKRLDDEQEVLECKKLFFAKRLSKVHQIVPPDMWMLAEQINVMKFEDRPDYEFITKNLKSIAATKDISLSKKLDWIGKKRGSKEANIKQARRKKKVERNKLNAGDKIRTDVYHWKVLRLMGSGGFGDVYAVTHVLDPKETEYAMKTEMRLPDVKSRLNAEITILQRCHESKGKHFVGVIDRGSNKVFKLVVMTLMGLSLEQARRTYGGQFSRSTALQCAMQTLEALRDLHQLGFLHRDVKPHNFVIGPTEYVNTIYVLDFGIARKYTVGDTTEVRKKRSNVPFLGTIRFASRACHECVEQGRKDDLESWVFMMFDFLDDKYGITWKRLSDRNAVLEKKKTFFKKIGTGELFASIPDKLVKVVEIVDSLAYEDKPDYEYINTLIQLAAAGININLNEPLDWMKAKALAAASATPLAAAPRTVRAKSASTSEDILQFGSDSG